MFQQYYAIVELSQKKIYKIVIKQVMFDDLEFLAMKKNILIGLRLSRWKFVVGPWQGKKIR